MRRYIITLCGCIMIGLVGCGQKNDEVNNVITKKTEQNPFDLEEMEKSGENIDASYGWWIANHDIKERKIDYKEGNIVLDITFDNTQGKCESGMAIFIDGIAQKYTINECESYIYPIKLEAKTETTIEITFEPQFDKTKKNHQLYMASVYNPSYRANEKNLGYGNNGNFLPGLMWNINYDGENGIEFENKENVYKQITEDMRVLYGSKSGDKTISKLNEQLIIDFYQDENQITDGCVDISKKMQLRALGGIPTTYRLCAMINNEPMAIFEGDEYYDIEIKEDKMIEIEVDFSKLKGKIPNYSMLYFTVCPLDDDNDLLLDKTESLILMK